MKENGTITNRIDWIDSVRGVFIFLVVLGHMSAGSLNNTILGYTHYFIYCIHMSVFILISGMFGKKKYRLPSLIKNYIIPYILFDFLYVIWGSFLGHEVDFNILFPTYVYWYILAIALYRLLTSHVNHHLMLMVSIILAFIMPLYLSEKAWRFMSIGRIALLFPIYYLGMIIPYDKWEALRARKLPNIAIGLLCIALEFYFLKKGISQMEWATHDYYRTHSELLLKYCFMIFAFGIFLMIASIVPKARFLQQWGRNSIIIYLLHPFFTDIAKALLRKIPVASVPKAMMIYCISILITWLLSSELLKSLYNKGINRIAGVIIRE